MRPAPPVPLENSEENSEVKNFDAGNALNHDIHSLTFFVGSFVDYKKLAKLVQHEELKALSTLRNAWKSLAKDWESMGFASFARKLDEVQIYFGGATIVE